MKKCLTRVGPLRAGIVMAIFYGLLGLLFAPAISLASWASGKGDAAQTLTIVHVLVMFFLLPVIYAAIGFLAGVVGAALYNLVTRWTGGLVFEVTDIAN